jgi:hypothetical protein
MATPTRWCRWSNRSGIRPAVRKLGGTVELVVHPEESTGWLSMLWDLLAFADWFDKYLPTSAGKYR